MSFELRLKTDQEKSFSFGNLIIAWEILIGKVFRIGCDGELSGFWDVLSGLGIGIDFAEKKKTNVKFFGGNF